MLSICGTFFFLNVPTTSEFYPLSLHDALPISGWPGAAAHPAPSSVALALVRTRSEEHTSELQSRLQLVCRLLLEKKNNWSTLSSQPGYFQVITALASSYIHLILHHAPRQSQGY